jgi:hypothetical protein
MADAKSVLGSKGAKLHPVEMHLRHTDNKGYISKTDLRDKNGHPPTDGQKDHAEHAHSNIKELLAHVEQTMSQQPPTGDDEQQEAAAPQPGAMQPGAMPPGGAPQQ